MKCETDKGWGGFYPQLIGSGVLYIADKSIARYLGLEYKEYVNFITENNGFLDDDTCFFKTREECQKFIEEFIEPRIVMQELIK